MLRVGIVMEGTHEGYDEKAVRMFIRRLAGEDSLVVARPCGNRRSVIEKFPNYLEEFRHRGDIELAVVMLDGDGRCFGDLVRKMEPRIAGRPPYPFTVRYHVVRQELETWLLADNHALKRLVQGTVQKWDQPESLMTPKEELKKILSEAGLSYTSDLAERLAQDADIEVLKTRCPSFRRFANLLATKRP